MNDIKQKKMYGIYSQKQNQILGFKSEYKTPSGGVVIVTEVSETPGCCPSTVFDDKIDMGEVTEHVKTIFNSQQHEELFLRNFQKIKH